MKGRQKLTRKELRRRKRRRQVIRNRIIFGAACLLLFVALVALLSWIVSLVTGGGGEETKTPTDVGKNTEAVIPPDYPEDRVGRYDYTGQRNLIIGTGRMEGMSNPFFAESEGDRSVADYTQLKLVTRDEKGRIAAGNSEPCLAGEYAVILPADTQGAVVYEFVLKQGLVFSDGTPIDSSDVLFSLYVLLDPLYTGPCTLSELDIVGLEDFRNQADTDPQETVSGIKGILAGKKRCEDGVERETIQIMVSTYDKEDMEAFCIPVVPRHCFLSDEEAEAAAGNYGVSFADSEFMEKIKGIACLNVGAGPYVLQGTPGESPKEVLLKANENFCLSAPKNGAIVLKSLDDTEKLTAAENKLVDYVTYQFDADEFDTFEEQMSGYGVDYGTYGEPVMAYLGINAKEIPDINVRRALASVMDKSLIAEAYPAGAARALDGPADSDSWVYHETQVSSYDETGAEAVRLLEQSGYFYRDGVMGKDGEVLSFYFSISSDLETCPAGAMLDNAKQILESIGCDVTITVREDLISEILIGDRSCFFITRSMEAEPDTVQLYYTGQETGDGLIRSVGLDYLKEYGSEEEKVLLSEINTLIAENFRETEYDQKAAITAKIYENVASLAVELPLYQPVTCYIYNTSLWSSDVMAQFPVTAYAGLEYYIWQLPGENAS